MSVRGLGSGSKYSRGWMIVREQEEGREIEVNLEQTD